MTFFSKILGRSRWHPPPIWNQSVYLLISLIFWHLKLQSFLIYCKNFNIFQVTSSGIFELEIRSFEAESPYMCSDTCRFSVCAKQFQWQIQMNQNCTYGQANLFYKKGSFLNGSTIQLPFTTSWPVSFLTFEVK